MSKLVYVKKSRNEWTCSKCGKKIAVGMPYYRGRLGFHNRDIIRCNDCKLEMWEVTTSDYQLEVCEIIYRWQDTYGISESCIDDIVSALEEIKDGAEERFDNIPENLQEASAGALLTERIEGLNDTISELENIDVDTIKSTVYEDYLNGAEDKFTALVSKYEEKGTTVDFDFVIENEDGKFDGDTVDELTQAFEEALSEEIQYILDEIPI